MALLTYDDSITLLSRKDNTISTTITVLVVLLMLVLGLNRWNLGFEKERVVQSCCSFEKRKRGLGLSCVGLSWASLHVSFVQHQTK